MRLERLRMQCAVLGFFSGRSLSLFYVSFGLRILQAVLFLVDLARPRHPTPSLPFIGWLQTVELSDKGAWLHRSFDWSVEATDYRAKESSRQCWKSIFTCSFGSSFTALCMFYKSASVASGILSLCIRDQVFPNIVAQAKGYL